MNIQVTAEQALLLREIIRSAIQVRKEVLNDKYFTEHYLKLTAKAEGEVTAFENLLEQLVDAEE